MVQLNEEPKVPEGTYPVEVTKCEHKVGPSGSPMWSTQFQIIDGVNSATIYDNIVFSPRAMGMAIQKLRALGYDVSSGMNFDETNTEGCVGRRAMATIAYEEYQGRISPKIKVLAPYRLGNTTGQQAGGVAGAAGEDYGKIPF